jgi:ABC-type lipoprotein release transport system permease subunit
MNALLFAIRTLRRQPARASLGILGVAAVGALLFDMLMLSRGLVLSMQDALDRGGFDVRVTATASLPGTGPRMANGSAIAATFAALPEVEEAVPLRFGDGRADTQPGAPAIAFVLFGAEPSRLRPWTVVNGRDLPLRTDEPVHEILINEALGRMLRIEPGSSVTFRASCARAAEALPPVTARVAGIARFPFDPVSQGTAAMNRLDFAAACGRPADDAADIILASVPGGVEPERARDAMARARPDLSVATNAQLVGRLEESGFSYFRQISTVLASVTAVFGLLLITVLLTVSVNQRLGTIAALRAIGFSRRRMITDVIAESALMVGTGGILAIPAGFLLAGWLDRILKRIPGIPAELHFFVFEPRALAVHVLVLVMTAVVAALYPVRLVARLPIAATLRDETTS